MLRPKLIRKHLDHNAQGFTLVELMIATALFSSILLLITFGLLSIGQNYYKGKNSARTQDVARRVIDEISQAIQFGDAAPSPEIKPNIIRAYFKDPGIPSSVDKQFDANCIKN